MVGEAKRRFARSKGVNVDDKTIYPWPMPDVLGISLDPKEIAKVNQVRPGSPGDQSGFKAGDEILEMLGQPILSIADVQWVLHQAKEPSTIQVLAQRGKEKVKLKLPIVKGWRRTSDIGWRTTSWDLRRMAAGGLKMRNLNNEEIKSHGLHPDNLALLVEHAGKYGDHGVAHRAGLKKGDILVEFDGISTSMRETEIFAHVLRKRPMGTEVQIKIIRNGEKKSFDFKLQ